MAELPAIEVDGEPAMNACPLCGNTDDLWLMECAPGYTWTFVNGCGCFGFFYCKPDPNRYDTGCGCPDVPRETKEAEC